ncbi:hypothetical protein MKEN_01146900 [Mycena kentingensis (nom. inval.)]|nr:hypothetical protein MKEN_01146900 [Mycena kentingensis (nom. inval.)]
MGDDLGLNEPQGRFYFFVQESENGEEKALVVQAATVVPEGYLHAAVVAECLSEWDREFNHALDVVHSLLWSIDFGQTNWAYLIGSNNNYRLVPRNVRLSRCEIPSALHSRVSAPFIPESSPELKITGYVTGQERFGVWRGRKVDVFVAWDERSMRDLRRMVEGLGRLYEAGRSVEGLASEVLGFVVRDSSSRVRGLGMGRGGDVVGIVRQPEWGRTVRREDKSKVYRAISLLERAGLMCDFICPSSITVSPAGDVRIAPETITVQPADPVAREEALEDFHWSRLSGMFALFEQTDNFVPTPREAGAHSALEMAPVPRLGRELVVKMSVFVALVVHPEEKEETSKTVPAIDSLAGPTRTRKGRQPGRRANVYLPMHPSAFELWLPPHVLSVSRSAWKVIGPCGINKSAIELVPLLDDLSPLPSCPFAMLVFIALAYLGSFIASASPAPAAMALVRRTDTDTDSTTPQFPTTPASCGICQQNYPAINLCMREVPVMANFTSVLSNPGSFVDVVTCACKDPFHASFGYCVDCFQRTDQDSFLNTDNVADVITGIDKVCALGDSVFGAGNPTPIVIPDASFTGTSIPSATPTGAASMSSASGLLFGLAALLLLAH